MKHDTTGLARWDAARALLAGGVSFAVYVRSLAPGLVATMDSPMFQFVGRELGVAHPPGYPLYVLVTHLFSRLPFEPLAYRINLFSAVMAAAAVSLVYIAGRLLGARPMAAMAAALGLAFGQVFWSQAVIAEVYTLNAAIVAGTLAAILAWGRTKRPALFFLAVGLVALGLGNHTTIVGFLPALAAFALLTAPSFARRPKTIGMAAALLLAGLLQYGFILLRSHHPGAYVEAPARTLPQLVDVMLARQFGFALFSFGWQTVVFENVPALVRGVLLPDFTLPGLLLAAGGLLVLLRRRRADGVLLLLGFGAVFAFVANYSADDLPVFLIPAILVLWIAAAAGGEAAARAAGRYGPAVAAGMLVLPAWLLASNFAINDRSRDVDAQVSFDALFEALPSRAALLHEDFLTDRMVMYQLMTGAAAGRQVELLQPHPALLLERLASGTQVFGFGRAVRRLRLAGLDADFAPLRTTGPPLPEFLEHLRDGTIVAIAVPARFAGVFRTGGLESLRRIGAGEALHEQALARVVVGVRGASTGAVHVPGLQDAQASLGTGEPIGGTGVLAPPDLEVRAEQVWATIRQGGRDLVRSRDGVVMVLWHPDGTRAATIVLEANGGLRVPVPANPVSAYQIRGEADHQTLGVDGWSDVSASVRSGTTVLRVPRSTSAVLYLGDDGRLVPQVADRSAGIEVHVEAFERDAPALRQMLTRDRLDLARLADQQYVYRIAATAGPGDGDDGSVLLTAGGVPAVAAATLAGGRGEGRVFRVRTEGLLRRVGGTAEVLLMHRDEQGQLFGDGWSSVDTDGITPFRWMSRDEARFVLPLSGDGARAIRIQAHWTGAHAPAAIALRVNGRRLPSIDLQPGWHAYEWPVDDGFAAAGPRDASVFVNGADLPRGAAPGVAVSEIRVEYVAPGAM